MVEGKNSQDQFLSELMQRKMVVTTKIKELQEVVAAIERLEKLERSIAQTDLFPTPSEIITVNTGDLAGLDRTPAIRKVMAESSQQWFSVSMLNAILDRRGFKSDSQNPANLTGEALNRLYKLKYLERETRKGRLHYRINPPMITDAK